MFKAFRSSLVPFRRVSSGICSVVLGPPCLFFFFVLVFLSSLFCSSFLLFLLSCFFRSSFPCFLCLVLPFFLSLFLPSLLEGVTECVRAACSVKLVFCRVRCLLSVVLRYSDHDLETCTLVFLKTSRSTHNLLHYYHHSEKHLCTRGWRTLHSCAVTRGRLTVALWWM